MPPLTGRTRYRIGANLIPVVSWRDASVEDLTIEARDLIRRGG